METHIREILIQNPKEKGVFCETFVYEPENIEEIKLGNLYIIGQIQQASPDSSHLINLLASLIKREYYFKPLRGPLQSLEEGCKKANAALSDLAKAGNLDWLNKINFVVAVLVKKPSLLKERKETPKEGFRLYAAQVGQTKILLLRENRLTNISKKLVPTPEKVHPSKVFQNIIAGKIFLHDKILLMSNDLSQYLSWRGLRQILALGQINQIEAIIKNKENFSSEGIIAVEIELEKKSAVAAGYSEKNIPSQIQIPVGQKQIRKIQSLKFIWLFKIKNLIFKAVNRAWRQIKYFSAGLFIIILEKSRKWQINLFLRKLWQKIPLTIKKLFAEPNLIWKKMNRPQKIAISAILFIIFIFGLGLMFGQKEQIPAASPGQKSEQSGKLPPLLDFKTAGLGLAPQHLLISDEMLFFIDPNADNIYQFNQGNSTILTGLPKNQNWLAAVFVKTEKGNLIVLLSQSQNFYQYNISNQKISPLSLILPRLPSPGTGGQADKNAVIKAMAAYQGNLYLLDSQNNQIIKCAGLTTCQLWLKGKSDLSQALSLAIDGSIYIFNSDGSITEYFNGSKKETFKIKSLFSSQISAGQIFTRSEFNNLYLLDPLNQRIIVLNKNGQLIKQYQNSDFSDLIGLAISSDEKNIFVLNGLKLYQLNQ